MTAIATSRRRVVIAYTLATLRNERLLAGDKEREALKERAREKTNCFPPRARSTST